MGCFVWQYWGVKSSQMDDEEELPTVEMPASMDEAALAAMRRAHLTPRVLSVREAEEFQRFRRTSAVKRMESIWRARCGNAAFRIKGHRGADLPYPPFEWAYRKALARYELASGANRTERQVPDPMLGVRSRQTKAQVRAQRVLALYPDYLHRGRSAAALMAKRLNEQVHYVQRILRENVHDRKKSIPDC